MKYVNHMSGKWYCRIRPKAHLRPFLPIKTLEYSKKLDATSASEAETQAIPIIAKWLYEIQVATEAYEEAVNPSPVIAGSQERELDEIKKKVFLKKDDEVIHEDDIEQLEDWVMNQWSDADDNPFGSTPSKDFLFLQEMSISRSKGIRDMMPTDFYLKEYRAFLDDLRDKTADLYISRIVNQFIPRFPYLYKKVVTTPLLQDWIDSYTELPRDERPSSKTLHQYLHAIRGYIDWLKRKNYLNLDTSGFREVKMPRDTKLKKAIKVLSFQDTELKQLLSASEEDTCLNDLIKLAMYTGARIEELMQLRIQHIRNEALGLVISIEIITSDEGKEISGKSDNAERLIPVHPEAQSIVKERIKNSKDTYLFKATPDREGKRANAIGKRFGRLKTKLGFKRNQVFHSIRHTVTTKLDRTGIPQPVIADIIGHEKENITQDKYSDGITLEHRFEVINLLVYKLSKSI